MQETYMHDRLVIVVIRIRYDEKKCVIFVLQFEFNTVDLSWITLEFMHLFRIEVFQPKYAPKQNKLNFSKQKLLEFLAFCANVYFQNKHYVRLKEMNRNSS